MRKLFLISLILLTACRKKEVTCTGHITDIPASIIFYGFNKSDLDTLIVNRYAPNNSFTQIIITDTVISPDVTDINGYLYADSTKTSFFATGGYDLKIYAPSIAKTFYVHVSYRPPIVETWTQEGEDCRPRLFTQAPDSVLVNGNEAPLADDVMYYYCIKQ